MSFKATSKLFDKNARRQAFARNPLIAAKAMANDVEQKHRASVPSGRPIKKVRGEGFALTRRRSARGQRPAVITGAVASGGVAKKTGELSARFGFSNGQHPGSNKSVKEIAEILQEKLSRNVVDSEDIKKADEYFQEINQKTLKSLL